MNKYRKCSKEIERKEGKMFKCKIKCFKNRFLKFGEKVTNTEDKQRNF